jgi:hypothetical protein
MNSEPKEFETLRKLMALKRHEQPPPGYFNRLPDQIAARLERGDGKLAFWENFLGAFTFRPALAYGCVLAAFSALTLSVVYSVRTQPQESAQSSGNGWQTGAEQEALATQSNPSEPMHATPWMGYDNASNPASAMPSLFESAAHHLAVPVSFAGTP